MNNPFGLLVLFQFKHFLADYVLQGRYMLGKFKDGRTWILPLLCHSFVHGIFTYSIAHFVRPGAALWLALLDASIHFGVDRVKASPEMLGRFKALSAGEYRQAAEAEASFKETLESGSITGDMYRTYATALEAERLKLKSNKYFWITLGLDQMAHHLTDILIVWSLLR